MSYYILPKINNIFFFDIDYDNKSNIFPFVSQTLLNYYNEITTELKQMCNSEIVKDISCNNYSDMLKIIHPYEYIFSKVPGSKFSVSKLKPKSNMFYDLIELIQNTNFLDNYRFDKLNTLIIGENFEDSLECLEMLRETYSSDKFFCFKKLNSELYTLIEHNKFNLIIYEIDTKMIKNINFYIIKLLEILSIILINLNNNGCVIIKIENIFYKPVIDVLYILSSFFEKLLIVKPNTSNITNFEKYIVVKNFNNSSKKNNLYKHNLKIIKEIILLQEENEIKNDIIFKSIISVEIPYYFLSKIEDFNIIMGQKQLEALDQILNILKNKNKYDKIEILKKSNIQKSVNWCEKFKIPCNKFSEKINIFLPIIKDKSKGVYIKNEIESHFKLEHELENELENELE